MPEQIRALIVILLLSTALFVFAQKIGGSISSASSFTRRRNLWLALTLSAFLSNSFWIFAAFAIPLLLFANRRESNPPALYFFILLVLPVASIQIPGMGLVNFLFDLTYARILALFVLLPAYFSLLAQGDHPTFGRSGPDKALTAYLALVAALYLREDTFTNTLRHAFYLFTDVFLPYYVISRSLRSMHAFRDAIFSLVMAITILAPLAIFEATKHWLLYSSVTHALDLNGGMTGYLGRDGMLRAIATTGQPIALGYVMTVGIGFYLYLQRLIQSNHIRRIGMLSLIAGIIAPLSRGPWIGAAVLIFAFISTGRNALRRLAGITLAITLFVPMVAMLPGGERVINLLPFIGNTEKGNIDYREQLLTNSLIVIQRNPWFGSPTFLDNPEMQGMVQGEGIVDIVNSYLFVALETGFVGLGLFVAFFVLTLLGISRAMRSIPDKDSEEYLLGRALLSTQLAIMVIIFTVSSISVIPIVYWSVAGIGMAYAQMVRNNVAAKQNANIGSDLAQKNSLPKVT